MKNTFRLATSAMMRPLGEMLFSNGRDQGMAAGANMVRLLAAADYDQSRAQGQQRRNYMQSNEGLGKLARAFGGDFSGYNLDGLDETGQQKARDAITSNLQMQALTGDTNYQQYAKGLQDVAVHDAAVYGKNPTAAATLAAAFNNGKLWDSAGNGQTFNVATGGMRDSGLTQAIMGEKAAQAQYNLAGVNERNAHAGLYGAQTQGVMMDNQVMPLNDAAGGSGLSIEQVWPGLIGQESGGKQSAVSPKGAIGIAQVMPGTAPIAAKLAGLPYDERRYRTDAQYNAALGKAYLTEMHRIFGGDMKLAMAAYNAGPGAVQKALARDRQAGGSGSFESVARFLPRETQNYVPSILNRLGGGVRRKYAEPLLAKRSTGEEKVTPLSGQLGDAFKIQLTGPDGRPMMDINDRPIMGDDTDSRQRFYRWMNASGNRDMNAALIQWEAQGRPDAGSAATSEIPADSLAGQLANALMPGVLGGSPRQTASQTAAHTNSQKVDSRITSRAIMEQAQMSRANPGMVVAQLRKNGIDVPQTVLAELKRQGFAVN